MTLRNVLACDACVFGVRSPATANTVLNWSEFDLVFLDTFFSFLLLSSSSSSSRCSRIAKVLVFISYSVPASCGCVRVPSRVHYRSHKRPVCSMRFVTAKVMVIALGRPSSNFCCRCSARPSERASTILLGFPWCYFNVTHSWLLFTLSTYVRQCVRDGEWEWGGSVKAHDISDCKWAQIPPNWVYANAGWQSMGQNETDGDGGWPEKENPLDTSGLGRMTTNISASLEMSDDVNKNERKENLLPKYEVCPSFGGSEWVCAGAYGSRKWKKKNFYERLFCIGCNSNLLRRLGTVFIG